jgi:hypothetical protein
MALQSHPGDAVARLNITTSVVTFLLALAKAAYFI